MSLAKVMLSGEFLYSQNESKSQIILMIHDLESLPNKYPFHI